MQDREMLTLTCFSAALLTASGLPFGLPAADVRADRFLGKVLKKD